MCYIWYKFYDICGEYVFYFILIEFGFLRFIFICLFKYYFYFIEINIIYFIEESVIKGDNKYNIKILKIRYN